MILPLRADTPDDDVSLSEVAAVGTVTKVVIVVSGETLTVDQYSDAAALVIAADDDEEVISGSSDELEASDVSLATEDDSREDGKSLELSEDELEVAVELSVELDQDHGLLRDSSADADAGKNDDENDESVDDDDPPDDENDEDDDENEDDEDEIDEEDADDDDDADSDDSDSLEEDEEDGDDDEDEDVVDDVNDEDDDDDEDCVRDVDDDDGVLEVLSDVEDVELLLVDIRLEVCGTVVNSDSSDSSSRVVGDGEVSMVDEMELVVEGVAARENTANVLEEDTVSDDVVGSVDRDSSGRMAVDGVTDDVRKEEVRFGEDSSIILIFGCPK